MKNNKDIFEYIKPKKNDDFSKISGLELQELLFYLENYFLEYRDVLNFKNDVTFGMELELSNSNDRYIKNKLKLVKPKWETKSDGSLNNGIEVISPILRNTRANWENVDKVCSIVHNHSLIDASCGGHVHVGVQTLGNKRDSWLNFLKLWSVYENVIYRFVYGDYLTPRPKLKRYAPPMSKNFYEAYEFCNQSEQAGPKEIIRFVGINRYQAVNFSNVKNFNKEENKNTIEFRCPNGTMNSVVWQNNINLFVNMLLYAKSPDFNHDILDKRKLINEGKYNNLNWYKELYLDQVLEFCDLIFNTNEDKIYFLRQYLKSFEIGEADFKKCKKFVKKG